MLFDEIFGRHWLQSSKREDGDAINLNEITVFGNLHFVNLVIDDGGFDINDETWGEREMCRNLLHVTPLSFCGHIVSRWVLHAADTGYSEVPWQQSCDG
jgi:hypothetical protein